MEPLTIGIIGCVALVVLLVLGVHIGFALALVGFVGTIAIVGWSPALSTFMTTPFYVVANYSLTPLPLFVFMASLCLAGGLTTALYDTGEKFLRGAPGGLGIATAIGSTIFGMLSGSALVVAAMFTKIAIPEMKKYNYNRQFAHGIVTGTSVIGMLIPPSMVAILWGIIASESIGRLFLAGIAPGLITCAAFSLLIFIMVKRNPQLAPMHPEPYTREEKIKSLNGVWPILIVAALMLGGIFGGLFTVTEGAAVGVIGSLLVLIGMKRMNWGILKFAAIDTVKTNCMIVLLLIGANLFARFITMSGLTQAFCNLITESGLPEMAVLGGFVVIFLILGCFLDPFSQMCIILPILIPVMEMYGWDSIYVAMLMLYVMHVGTITPPVGLCLFATKGAAEPDVPFEEIVRGCVPFMLVMLGITALLFFNETITIGFAAFMH